eukprot:8422209-Ditylum_brightwellii.AAC.1
MHCHCHHRDVIVIVTICQLCQIKDTANTSPKQPKEPTSPQTTTRKHNNQLSGASTGTSRAQLSHCHHHYGNAALLSDRQKLVPLSWPQNQEMAPMTQGVYSASTTPAGDIVPLRQ